MILNRIKFLLIGVTLLSGILLTFCGFGVIKKTPGTAQIKQANILWIVADDLGPDLACYGNPNIQTPNLDDFSKKSIRFTNCHTSTAVCSPSRSGMVTGMYPVSINCHQHRTRPEAMLPLPEGVKVITEYFEQAGYFTFNGNCEHPERPGKQDYNFKTDYKIYDGTDWSERKDGQPFFGQIQIHKPHRPFLRDLERPVDASKVKLPPYWPDHKLARQDWAFYLETVQLVDKEVGEILKRLEEDGLADNTYVFFVGDQGSPMMRHKQFLYDGGTNTPLLVRFPKGKHAGELRDELISNIDLAATSLLLAGLDIPAYMQGQNFLGDHTPRQEVYTMRDRRDETVDRIRAVRTNKYKYIRNFYPEKAYTQYNAYKRNKYPVLPLMEVLKEEKKLSPAQLLFLAESRPSEELYDLESDPFEINNLAENNNFSSVKNELSQKLDQWIEVYDKAAYPEDQLEIDYWTGQMRKMDSLWKGKKNLPLVLANKQYVDWWENKFDKLVKMRAKK